MYYYLLNCLIKLGYVGLGLQARPKARLLYAVGNIWATDHRQTSVILNMSEANMSDRGARRVLGRAKV